MSLVLAREITGGLGFPSKMPGSSYGLPAQACKIGSKLMKVPGSTCSACYAMKDHYVWPGPITAQARRLAGINHPFWASAMVKLLLHTHRNKLIKVDLGKRGVKLKAAGGSRYGFKPSGYHRWHDSGDLQSVRHLAAICVVCRLTPKIKHWLPTQELGMVREYLKMGGTIPSNLVIRVSSVMVDKPAQRSWPHRSSVFAFKTPVDAHICPAPQQDHACGDCRACWSQDVEHVGYEIH